MGVGETGCSPASGSGGLSEPQLNVGVKLVQGVSDLESLVDKGVQEVDAEELRKGC